MDELQRGGDAEELLALHEGRNIDKLSVVNRLNPYLSSHSYRLKHQPGGTLPEFRRAGTPFGLHGRKSKAIFLSFARLESQDYAVTARHATILTTLTL